MPGFGAGAARSPGALKVLVPSPARVSALRREEGRFSGVITLHEHAATGCGTYVYVGNHCLTRWGWASREINWVRVALTMTIYHPLFLPRRTGGARLASYRGPGCISGPRPGGQLWTVILVVVGRRRLVWAPKERCTKVLGKWRGNSEGEARD
jgi:hypothetical protein